MNECLGVIVGILLAAAVGDPSPWSQQPVQWKQSRVQPHSGLNIVTPPKLSRRAGTLPGYLPLRPVNSYRHSRWFDSDPVVKQHNPNSRAGFDSYPPFWSGPSLKTSKSLRPHHSSSPHLQPHKQHRQPKKDCNPCNSVPWTPIFKSPAGLSSNHQPRELVPHVEVYPDASIQHQSIVSPQNLISHVPVPTLSETSPSFVGLPAGNYPISPNLLFLPQQQQIPFPELSPHPVAPVHETISFHPDPVGLVPPAPPKDSVNVVFTISEQDKSKDVHIVPQDQHSESSSFVDSRLQHNVYHQSNQLPIHHQVQNQHHYRPPNGGLDIVKSVPLAEYTSSIDHPVQVIQSNPYIDINSPSKSPNTVEYTYEKPPKTGSQKVSDFILEVGKDTDSQKSSISDSSPAGSDKVPEHAALPESESADTKPKASKVEDSYRDHFDPNASNGDYLDPNILTPPAPPLPPHLTQLLPTYDTAFLHPLLSLDTKGVASSVNGALLPPPQPQPMNPTTLNPTESTVPPKKIQIIIPYTTINNNHWLYQKQGSNDNQITESGVTPARENTWPPIVVTEAAQNQPRRVPHSQPFNESWGAQVPSQLNQVQHILTSQANIRDLLKKEMEPKQNIRLQKNIDNWTALEYSNHKTVGKKQPIDVISHAQAVTSIPGTSISHLLFPSKKIPDGYFPTSVAPNFDEPATTPFPATSVSVNSEPFTTVSRYSSVAWSGPTRTSRYQIKSTTPIYSEIAQDNSPAPRWSDYKVSVAPGTNEKVYVVTPESYGATRRSTRHIDTTEKYTPTASNNGLFTRLEKIPKNNVNNTVKYEEKPKSKQKPLYPKSTALFKIKADASRYEKISKFNKPKPIDKFFATTTRPLNQGSVDTISSTELPSSTSNVLTTGATATVVTTPAQFPFRNGGEIPLEMSQVNFSSSQLTFKNTGSRKTLIKQVKTNRLQKDGKAGAQIGEDETVEPSPHLEIDIVFPTKSASKKVEGKKPFFTKKKEKDTAEKPDNRTVIKADEPNITEDDREEINDLIKELTLRAERENETMVAVETSRAQLPNTTDHTPTRNSSTSLLDTIRLLRKFLAETSEEDLSKEKNENLEKVIQKLSTTEKSKKLGNPKYKYNFPEYLDGGLQLNKVEMSLVKSAMIELKKSKTKQ